MRFSSKCQWIVRIVLIMASGLTLAVSCTGVGEKIAHNVNPCGTILNCDPMEYDLLTTEYPDWNADPTCTIPGQCGGFPVGGTTGTTTTQ